MNLAVGQKLQSKNSKMNKKELGVSQNVCYTVFTI